MAICGLLVLLAEIQTESMDLSKVLSITGYPGLYKLVSKMKGGVLVESMADGKRMPAYTAQKIMALDDVSIYTDAEDVRLSVIYDSIIDKTGGKPVADPKTLSNDALRDLLASVLPNFDRERVYNSDIKKLFSWFNILAEKGLAVKTAPTEEKEEVKEEKKATKKAKADDATPAKTAAPKVKVPTSKAKAQVSTQRKAGKV